MISQSLRDGQIFGVFKMDFLIYAAAQALLSSCILASASFL